MHTLLLSGPRTSTGVFLGIVAVLLPYTASAGALSDTAYLLLTERVAAPQTSSFVYQDADSGLNHGFPSGFFGAVTQITLDAACVDDPNTASGCATNPDHLDVVRGTVLRLTFAPLAVTAFAGVNIEEPENFGVRGTGRGYDLTGSTRLEFEVRSPTPGGITVQFGVGGGVSAFMHIPQGTTYTTMSIPLNTLTPVPNISNVHLLFTVVTNGANAPNGGTLLLDNIRFVPAPTRQQAVLGLPLSTETLGVMPRQGPAAGRVTIPPDQANRNVATIFEASLTVLALLARGTEQDRRQARLIADTFVYALQHDNQGAPIPVAQDGSKGLHNAYKSGEIALFNDQGAGAGRAGDVQFAGFSAGAAVCGPSRFCLVLDGASGGNNAWAILALVSASTALNESRYLDTARTIGNWIVAQLTDITGTGFGGYYVGFPDGGRQPRTLLTSKSVESNAVIFTALAALASRAAQLGNAADAALWTARATLAGDFVLALFDAQAGCFHGGTVPVGTAPGLGIDPRGAQRGGDVINTVRFLDAQALAVLALAAAPRYRGQIDWRRPVQCVVDHFAQSITVGTQPFQGFNLVEASTAGPKGIAWEFTGQAITAMQVVDRLFQENRFGTVAALSLDQLRQAQRLAPFGDGQGLVASTLQDGDRLAPLEQCLSTPFQCIPERVGLAVTTWAIFADLGITPLPADTLTQPSASPLVPTPSAGGEGRGGCTLDPDTPFDPILVGILGLMIAFLAWKQRQERAPWN